MEISDVVLNKKQLTSLNKNIEVIDALLDDLNYLYRIREDVKNSGNEKQMDQVKKAIKSDEKWLFRVYKKALEFESPNIKIERSIPYLKYGDNNEEDYLN